MLRRLKTRIADALSIEVQGRIPWVDTARGLAIVLVVLFHSGLAARHLGSGQLAADYLRVSHIVDDMRMPLFFFCSGILAFWGLNKPWSVILKKRIAVLLWVIFVWTIIYFVYEKIVPALAWGSRRHPLAELFVVPLGTLWFMYAITGLSLLMRAIHSRSLPHQFAIVCFVNAGAIFALLMIDLGGYRLLMSNLARHAILCFAGGVWLAPVVTKLLATPRQVIFFASLATVGLAIDVTLSISVPLYESLPKIVQCAPKVLFGITFAALLALWTPVQNMCEWLGSRTLEIFLLHTILIGVLVNALHGQDLTENMALLIIFPTALVSSIICEQLAGRLGFGLLFRPPARLSWRAERAPQLT